MRGRRLVSRLLALWLAVPAGCVAPDDVIVDDPLQDQVDEGCPAIFHQDVFPDYRIQITPDEWAAMQDEFLHRAEREAEGLIPNPYHPIEFEYQGTSYPDVLIKLRGQSSWWQAIELDDDPKMQFTIAFNEVNPDGRFFGVRKIALDMPRSDASFLRQRLALYFLRRHGITAQCGNNGRLTVNGEYYGLYTNMEKLDKEFLQRIYGEDDDGDLWEGARTIKTNEDSFTWTRLSAFWDATSVEGLAALVDLDASVSEWAAEAMAPDGDGYYMGRANFFLYDHPERGFIWLPNDLDASFDYLAAEASPLFPQAEGRSFNDRRHWAIVMADPVWQERYVDDLALARESYDVPVLEGLIDKWADQIADAADGDPMKPFSTLDHQLAIEQLHDYPAARAQTVDDWLDCRRNGGPDRDGDGYDSCFDCDDQDAQIHPGAPELCNGKDDDCDGQIDEDELGEPLC